MMCNWKQYTLDGIASLAAPQGTIARLEEDSTLFVLTLPGEPETDILIGLFPLSNGDLVSDRTVRSLLTTFMERPVRNVAAVGSVSIEAAADVDDDNLCVWQAIAKIEGEDRWWMARIYGRRGGGDALLVHWNGPAKQLKQVVIKSFASIEPLFASTDPPTES